MRNRLRYAFLALAWVACTLFSQAAWASPYSFTVTADPRSNHTGFGNVLQAINTHLGGPGAFHVTIGDEDPPANNRAQVDSKFGAAAVWYPVIGNHEEETGADMQWVRAEYDTGNGVRTPLKNFTNQDGPTGTKRVNYSWSTGNAYFIVLNEYWDGGTTEGSGTDITKSDTATNGDVVTQLRTWLSGKLAANTKPFVFVIGHEPAFPYNRHVGDSLDLHVANRDAFWALLESYGVQAYFVGHTHWYSKHQGDKDHIGNTWQIDAGNAGNDDGNGKTFLNVVVDDTVGNVHADIEVWRDGGTGLFSLFEVITVPPRMSALTLVSNPLPGGTITANPLPDGTGKYIYGTTVTLTANAAAGYTFSNWSGDASGSVNPTAILMNGDKSVTANFTQLRYTLTLASNPSGSGTITANPLPGGDGKYAYGTVVTLTAAPADGFVLLNWSGDASGSSNPTPITMDGNKSVTTNFADGQTLTLNVVNSNYGTIAVEPNSPLYAPGTAVTLTATPIEGKSFREWTIWGDPNRYPDANYVVVDANAVLQLTMDHDYTVEAAFKCGSGVGDVLPLLVVGVTVVGFAARRIHRRG
jgi:uncharacterized repeat protein (TIGR02543 family)